MDHDQLIAALAALLVAQGGIIVLLVKTFVSSRTAAAQATAANMATNGIGEGEHRLLLIEKRNLTTSDVLGRLSRVFQIRRRDIGFAGLKDRRAVTRQWFSLPAGPTSGVSIEDFHQPGSTILREVRHTTKLKRGHLRGNRFHIRVRHAIAGSGPMETAAAAMSLREAVLTPTINYETPDPDCPIRVVANEALEQRIQTCIKLSYGFGGHNACLVLTRV